MTLQDQIKKRIENYKHTISLIDNSDKTDWHKKQIAVLQGRIEELEWLLQNLEVKS